jgi:hypothetical protein
VARTRVALAAVLVVTAGAMVLPGGAVAKKAFHFTHRVSVSGQFVDRWTIDDPAECGLVGSGSVTVNYRTRKSVRVRALVDPHATGQGSRSGSWELVAPQGAFGQVTSIRSQRAIATVTKVDNTTQRPFADGAPCTSSQDYSACPNATLRRSLSDLTGYDRRRLVADLTAADFSQDGKGRLFNCHIGTVSGFSSPPALAGGTARGELLIKMPKLSTLMRRHVTHVTGTSHKATTSPGDHPDDATYTDDVTRTVTVTFTRL